MSAKQAYLYLKQYAGIAFLDDCYEAEHQQTVETAIEDLTIVCQNHGGGLRYRKLNNQYFFGTERAINYLTLA